MKRYNPADIEKKWQTNWSENQIYVAKDFDEKSKFVMLTEFPYPSGAGLHMGHMREYTLGDVIARHKRMQGRNVLFPMGFDAFGLPTENYAIKNKIAPQVATAENVASFRNQLNMMGFGLDWNRSFSTTDPEYYRWTQWMFLRFYEKGLAYQAEVDINWCPFCKTGLANEEVINGRHERCDTLVERKTLKQWMLKITDYADRLIDGLKTVDYPSRIADQQINWIGRSVGAEVDFTIEDSDQKVTVFTTRPDTIFGATFIVLAPENPLVEKLTTSKQKGEVETYIRASQAKTDIERQETSREKTGVFTGSYAVNPANNEKIPIWIADYVLMGYGTGAIMAVPAHDERDHAFAEKFNLPIIDVIAQNFGETRDDEQPVDGITAIIYDESDDTFAVLDWNNINDYVTLVAGGRELNEKYSETARREISEEAGIEKIKSLIELGSPVFSHYHHDVKQINRIAKTQGFLAVVNDKQGENLSHEPHEDFSTKWISRKDFEKLSFAGKNKDTCHWDLLRKNALNHIDGLQNERFSGTGILIISGEFNDLESSEAKQKIVAWLSEKGSAREKVNYKLRDWVYSRQHYWGEPIPIIYCKDHGAVPVPDNQLPVELPKVDHYEPTDNGESPLAAIEDWANVDCPICGGPAKRETDTMPNWAGSNWYYLRYFDAHNNQVFADRDKLDYWGEVDLYLGGMEHTTLHLLYSRFHHQFLYDQGLVPTPEPYVSRRGQGIILAADGRKMSKSLGNVVDPTKVIDSGYGADALRLMITFIAPYDQTTPWSPEGVAGTYRFLVRYWNLVEEIINSDEDSGDNKKLQQIINRTIKKVSEDIDRMSFNTAVAALMEALNDLNKFDKKGGPAWRAAISDFTKLLAPFAPHITEEVWREILGNNNSVHLSDWPTWDEKLVQSDEMTIAVQVNGKLRGELVVPKDADRESIEQQALALENVTKFLGNKKPARVIYVPGKIVNVVVK